MNANVLNKGIHIVDRRVLLVAMPETAPTLVTHGYAVAQNVGGKVILPPYILVYAELEPDLLVSNIPFAEISYYGYVTPPSGGLLINDWRFIGKSIVQNFKQPNTILIPVIGYDRFACIITNVIGSPVSVRMRHRGISEYSAKSMIDAGLVSSAKGVDYMWVNVTNGIDATYNYYLDPREFKRLGLQFVINPGSGSAVFTIHLSQQAVSDPTAATYEDVTLPLAGAATIPASQNISDNAERLSTARWIRLTCVANTGGANDADWRVDVSGIRH